ncbi:hypothetical protein FEM48_Zijuj09G0162400 [Ziziphus jujuba var. spinosa]|uniref:Malectin-like domain-containing protein n=1 Tax=Ziziphus jujuba var. spinosa TaxID=714518 RepID=A0A978UU00_ZIZJJ|nr:hypothetical protein FEM48_Zijuj09G0162400 [Ziziphus jujuba var. spinosa]
MYDTEFIRTTSASLLLFKRLDIGHINGTDKKYQDDMYDRIWTSYMNTAIWDSLSTSQQINTVGNGNNVPSQVIMTAAKPQNGTTSFLFNWSANDSSSEFYIYMYFAELEQLNGKNQSRKFTVSWNGAPMFGTISPRYLFATTISSSGAVAGNKHVIYFYQTEDSTHPPILNALEIYLVKHMDESPTYSQDEPNSIVNRNLTSSNLSGIIAASIKELSSLEFLNLKGNQLSGKIPNALVKRWEAGLLTLSVDTQHLCDSGSCKKNNKIIVPVVASLSSAAVILILFVLGWILGRKGKTRDDIHPCEITCNEVQLRYFNYNGLNFLIMFNVNCQTLNIGNYHSDGLKTFAIFEANGVHVKLVEYELLGLQPSPFHCQ